MYLKPDPSFAWYIYSLFVFGSSKIIIKTYLGLEVGKIALDFEAELTNGNKVILADILSSGNKVILYFYPKDSTPGCTVQACDFRDNFSRLQSAGFRVIGVSKDSSKSPKVNNSSSISQ